MFSISFLEFNQIYGGRKQQRIFSIGEKKSLKNLFLVENILYYLLEITPKKKNFKNNSISNLFQPTADIRKHNHHQKKKKKVYDICISQQILTTKMSNIDK